MTLKLDLLTRPRRNRKSLAIRELVAETVLLPSDFVAPLFVKEGAGREPISSMPGVERLSLDALVKEARELWQLGIRAVDLFPFIPKNKKDEKGSEALRRGNLMHQALKLLKEEIPDLCLMVDIALDPYTTHGHDGLLHNGQILNDESVAVLAEMSVLAAEAGADVIAPSDMMDGRIGFIRKALDSAGYESVSLLSYAAKYASAFYGPFRDALESAPQFDKKTYQMNPANVREALLECQLDEQEGADILMVKPALAYLDVISKVKAHSLLPIAAYHVSGEYAMVKAAAEKGWVDGPRVMHECLLSIKRAGADIIFSYAAKEISKQIREST